MEISLRSNDAKLFAIVIVKHFSYSEELSHKSYFPVLLLKRVRSVTVIFRKGAGNVFIQNKESPSNWLWQNSTPVTWFTTK